MLMNINSQTRSSMEFLYEKSTYTSDILVSRKLIKYFDKAKVWYFENLKYSAIEVKGIFYKFLLVT